MSAPLPPHVVVESVPHVTPLGIGFWDVAAGRLASDALIVSVHPLVAARLLEPVAAVPNRVGVFVAHGLRGLRAFEAGAGDDAFWAAPHPPRTFVVTVRDPRGRYTPFALALSLPAPRHRSPPEPPSLVLPPCVADLWPAEPLRSPVESPARAGAAPAYVPLLSAPSRLVPAGMAAVRATLRDAGTGLPAAWAVLEVRDPGGDGRDRRLLARGIADERGQVAAIFPYPEPVGGGLTSPLGSPPAGARPLAEQEWPLEIAVRYRRDLPRRIPDPALPPLADLCDVLAQPLATTVVAGTSTPLATAVLQYGDVLVLGERAELAISPP